MRPRLREIERQIKHLMESLSIQLTGAVEGTMAKQAVLNFFSGTSENVFKVQEPDQRIPDSCEELNTLMEVLRKLESNLGRDAAALDFTQIAKNWANYWVSQDFTAVKFKEHIKHFLGIYPKYLSQIKTLELMLLNREQHLSSINAPEEQYREERSLLNEGSNACDALIKRLDNMIEPEPIVRVYSNPNYS